MYIYDELDQRIVDERVAQYRDQTRRFLAGELPDEEFRNLRLRNGLYIQRHAPMLRISIPYGMLSSRQLRMLAHIARKYDKGYGHITTRQNIQFHWPRLEDVPDILADLATVQMHAIQTSGNCVRNVTSDPLSGTVPDEVEDPRPWCELIRQWFTVHPEFNWLPRKFKIAVTATKADRAATQVHDIGLHLVRNADGETGFEVLAGGGLGRTPVIGKVVREFVPKRELLAWLESILRIYNLHGRRDNLFKSRIKILVNSLGIEEFRRQVEADFAATREMAPVVDDAMIGRILGRFTRHEFDPDAADAGLAARLDADRAFARWHRHNTRPHKAPGYRVVHVSLKRPGTAPGDITAAQMDALSDLADRYSSGEVVTTHEQNLVLAHVRERDLASLREALDAQGLATPTIGMLTDIICCPGLDYCDLAKAWSIPVAQEIQARFDDLDYLYDLGPIRLNMDGCMNSCGHHHVGHIGILGVDKGGESWYQIKIGGSSREDASLGEIIGPAVPRDAVADTVESIIGVYIEGREGDEPFLEFARRVGLDPFRERIYGNVDPRRAARGR